MIMTDAFGFSRQALLASGGLSFVVGMSPLAAAASVPRLAQAAIAFSPPAPISVLCTKEGYARLAVPALIQIGTQDIVPGITATDADGWNGHLAPFFAAAPSGKRYAVPISRGRRRPRSSQGRTGSPVCSSQPGDGNTQSRRLLDAAVSHIFSARLLRR